jgi:hypothetical protein
MDWGVPAAIDSSVVGCSELSDRQAFRIDPRNQPHVLGGRSTLQRPISDKPTGNRPPRGMVRAANDTPGNAAPYIPG